MENQFKFFLPADFELVKSKSDKGQEKMTIRGLASTNEEDADGEFLDPNGFDLSELCFLNWNHQKNPGAYIGEPINWSITKEGFLVEGELFPENDFAKEVWQMGKSLKNSKRGNRLGMSVEGNVVERDLLNPKKVLKAKITAIAIAPLPKNKSTWVDFVTKGEMSNEVDEWEGKSIEEVKKAFAAESESGEAVTTEDLEGSRQQKKKKKKKLSEDLESSEKDSKFTGKLNKSQIYQEIFVRVPGIKIDIATDVFNLINLMSKDKETITIDTIEKAFEFLGNIEKASKGSHPEPSLGSKDGSGVDSTEKKLTEAVQMYKSKKKEKMSDEDIMKSMKECGYDDEMMKKAKEINDLDDEDEEEGEESGEEEKKEKNKKKSEKKEDKVEKSQVDIDIEKVEKELQLLKAKKEGDLQKGQGNQSPIDIVLKELSENIKNFNTSNIEKAFNEGQQKTTELLSKGFQAIGEILKETISENEELKKSLGDVSKRLGIVEKTPLPHKTITKGYVKREGEEEEKNDGRRGLSVTNRGEKQELIKALVSTVSWQTTSQEDKNFLSEVQKFENGGGLTQNIIKKANEIGIAILQ